MTSSSDEKKGLVINTKVAVLTICGVAFLAFVILLRSILSPVLIAFVIAYIADPLLSWLERHRVRRWVATSVLYTFCLGLLAFTAITLGPKIGRQTSRLYRSAAGLASNYSGSILESGDGSQVVETGQDQPENVEDYSGSDSEADSSGQQADDSDSGKGGEVAVGEKLSHWERSAREYLRVHADEVASRVAALVLNVVKNTVKGVSNVASFLFAAVLVLVFTFFFMLHFREMVGTVKGYIPAVHRERTLRILGRIDGALSNFFRGRLLVCLISGFVYVLGLRLSGIEFWLLIGVFGGVLSFVPILGVVIPMIPAAVFAMLTNDPWTSLLAVLLTFSFVQWVVEPVAGTVILSKQVKMHPVTILLALLLGGYLFGVFGMLLSIPLAASVRILGEEFLLPPLREMADQRKAGKKQASSKV